MPGPTLEEKNTCRKVGLSDSIDYGIRELTAKKTGESLGNKNGNGAKPDSRDEDSLNIVTQDQKNTKEYFCKLCVGKHANGNNNCPAKNNLCTSCNRKGHYAKSWTCSNNSQSGPPRGAGRGGQQS